VGLETTLYPNLLWPLARRQLLGTREAQKIDQQQVIGCGGISSNTLQAEEVLTKDETSPGQDDA